MKKKGKPIVTFRPIVPGEKAGVSIGPGKIEAEPPKPAITIVPRTFDSFNQRNALETRRLYEGLASSSYCSQLRQDIRAVWDNARKYKGMPSRIRQWTQDIIKIRALYLQDIPDKGDVAKQCKEAMKFLSDRHPGFFVMKQLERDGSQFLFSLREDVYNRNAFPQFKFYCAARISKLFEIIVGFAEAFLHNSSAGIRFKAIVSDLSPGKAIENRFIVYAPVSSDAAGAASLALKSLSKEYFFPIKHVYGLPVSKGIAAFLISDGREQAMTERLEDSVYFSYTDVLSAKGLSESELFDLFFSKLVSKLKNRPHFKSCFT